MNRGLSAASSGASRRRFIAPVSTQLDIHMDIGRPKPLGELLASEQLTGVLNERLKNPKRLLLNPNPTTLPCQAAVAPVKVEDSEAIEDVSTSCSRPAGIGDGLSRAT